MTSPIRWLRTLARHYPSLLVSGVCHAAIGEIERAIKEAGCTGCFRLPTKDAPTYDMDCGECSRFYADMYATEGTSK